MATDLRSKLIALAEPLLTDLGYELVELELVPGRAQSQLRLFIDREAGIGIEDCEQVSRALSALLDVHDPIPSAYTLEVSSPGLDRVLRTPAHFTRFAGSRVHVETRMPRDGRRRWTGTLRSVDESGIDLEVDGVMERLAFAEISRARLVPEWPETQRRR